MLIHGHTRHGTIQSACTHFMKPSKITPWTPLGVQKSILMDFGVLGMHVKEVFPEKSCFKNFAHPLSEGENIKK